MAATNGFFGSLQGPFAANQELFTKIQEECVSVIDYISKLGINYIGGFPLDLDGDYFPQIFVVINGIEFQIGKTRILQLEDVQITSIYFLQDMNDRVYMDYQYEKVPQ